MDMDAGPSGALVPSGQDGALEEVDLASHPSGIVPQLQNVVATVNLDTRLDLKEIALHARNAEYNPKRFAAVIMRIREPKTTALIFASGKMVCTGAKSEQDSRLAARKYARIIQKLGFPATFKEFKIQNIVGSCDVRFPIRLEGLAYQHSLFAGYEPELFPGLIYRMKSPNVVLLIFVSGKVVLTGAKERKEIYTAFEQIYPTLQEFRKGDAAVKLPTTGLLQPPEPQQEDARKRPRADAAMLPPPSPAHRPNLPPATPMHSGHQLPPLTPHHSLPPATPAYTGGVYHTPSAAQELPPATPMHSSHQLPPATPMHSGLPPATPMHSGLQLPPPTPQRSLPPSTPFSH